MCRVNRLHTREYRILIKIHWIHTYADNNCVGLVTSAALDTTAKEIFIFVGEVKETQRGTSIHVRSLTLQNLEKKLESRVSEWHDLALATATVKWGDMNRNLNIL